MAQKIIVPDQDNPHAEKDILDKPAAPGPATYAELKAACAGADADFIVKQLDAGATVPQAQTAWMAELNKRATDAKAEAATAKTEATAAKDEVTALKAGRPGVKPLGQDAKKKDKSPDGEPDEDDEEVEGDAAKSAFNAKVHHYMETRKVPRTGTADQPGAIQLVAINHQKLHKQYLKATNPGKKMARMLDEKFDEVA